ncbi:MULTISPECIES: hypothetical protein [Pseudomonas]|uniref:hypothetical protein n=1 Tax=Pseudomonas nitroreducens TaxID=46680 RepID=UPI001E4120D4|nr:MULTISPECIES: hypothetical protein [Pseudomonas]MCE4071455.1 hypothetical protein [Pseudomonas nitritireducens]MCE4081231.1 hypothetical protein [Pseudomonas nitroreducens]
MESKYSFGIRRLLVFGCLLIGAQAVQAGSAFADRNAEVQEIRSLGYSVVINALLYYNLNGSPYQQDNSRDGEQSLERLLALTGRDFPGLSTYAQSNWLRLYRSLVICLSQLPRCVLCPCPMRLGCLVSSNCRRSLTAF